MSQLTTVAKSSETLSAYKLKKSEESGVVMQIKQTLIGEYWSPCVCLCMSMSMCVCGVCAYVYMLMCV